MPISACSYFQFEEYPAFMIFFYISMYVIELVTISIVVRQL